MRHRKIIVAHIQQTFYDLAKSYRQDMERTAQAQVDEEQRDLVTPNAYLCLEPSCQLCPIHIESPIRQIEKRMTAAYSRVSEIEQFCELRRVP